MSGKIIFIHLKANSLIILQALSPTFTWFGHLIHDHFVQMSVKIWRKTNFLYNIFLQ